MWYWPANISSHIAPSTNIHTGRDWTRIGKYWRWSSTEWQLNIRLFGHHSYRPRFTNLKNIVSVSASKQVSKHFVYLHSFQFPIDKCHVDSKKCIKHWILTDVCSKSCPELWIVSSLLFHLLFAFRGARLHLSLTERWLTLTNMKHIFYQKRLLSLVMKLLTTRYMEVWVRNNRISFRIWYWRS